MSTRILRAEPLGLRVVQDGEGPDVLLIGGLADDTTVWDAQVAALAHSFRVTRFDARGIPGAPTPPGPYTLDGLVADALAVLDASGIERAHVVGASLGGVIAQQLAIHHADRVASITLAATWARADRALRAVFSTWRWAADQGGSIADVLQLTYTSTYAAEAWNSGLVDRRLVDAEVAALRAGRPGSQAARQGFTWTAWAGLQHNATDELPKVHVPALIIVGARDLVLGPDHCHQLAALLPDSRLEVVPDAGHRLRYGPSVATTPLARR